MSLIDPFIEKFKSSIANVNGKSFGLNKGKGAFSAHLTGEHVGTVAARIRFRIMVDGNTKNGSHDMGYTDVIQGMVELQHPDDIRSRIAALITSCVPFDIGNLEKIMACIKHGLRMEHKEREFFVDLALMHRQMIHVILQILEKFNTEEKYGFFPLDINDVPTPLSKDEEALLRLAGEKPDGIRPGQEFALPSTINKLLELGLVYIYEPGPIPTYMVTQKGKSRLHQATPQTA